MVACGGGYPDGFILKNTQLLVVMNIHMGRRFIISDVETGNVKKKLQLDFSGAHRFDRMVTNGQFVFVSTAIGCHLMILSDILGKETLAQMWKRSVEVQEGFNFARFTKTKLMMIVDDARIIVEDYSLIENAGANHIVTDDDGDEARVAKDI